MDILKQNLIGISGKMGSGKDTVNDIINYLSQEDDWDSFDHFMEEPTSHHDKYKNKKFADMLKDTVCMWIGCTREQLEDRDFKETPLSEEWDCFLLSSSYGAADELRMKDNGFVHSVKRKMTPRLMMQLVGTEAGRQIIHPNIWVNALFADYSDREFRGSTYESQKSNWIITDVRFPNEVKGIEDRGGIVIRINRLTEEEKSSAYKVRAGRPNNAMELVLKDEHPSETSLDNHNFDYVIDNDGSISDLIAKIRRL